MPASRPTDVLRALLPGLRKEYGLSEVWIVGSHARGTEGPESDLDLVVGFGMQRPSLLVYAGLAVRLEDALGVSVDLVDRDAIRPEIATELMLDAIAL